MWMPKLIGKNQLICKKWTNNISLPDLSGYLCLYSSCLYAEHMCSCKRLPSCWFSWLFDCFFIRSIVTMPKCVYWQENGPSDHLHQCNSFPDKPDLGRCNPGYISPSGVNLSRVNFSRVHLVRVHHVRVHLVRVHLVRVHLVRVNLIWSCLLSSQSFHTWHCTMYGSVQCP